MIRKKIKELKTMIPILNDISQIGDLEVNGVSINTKELERGNLFVPLKGQKRDGHEFVEEAFKRGASASLWQKNVPNPPKHLPLIFVDDPLDTLQQLARAYRKELSSLKVVAVTGSNGKTTTKDMVAALLSRKYKVQKTIGNFNNHIGLPLTILHLKKETEIAVLEMGMNHFGEIDFLSKMAEPDAAIITNIGDAHLQELGSREGILKAKLEILNGLKQCGLFIYPGDEPLFLNHKKLVGSQWKKKTFGKSKANDLYVKSVKTGKDGTEFSVNISDEIFQLPIIGEYNVSNAMAAMLIAKEWGITFQEMNRGFSQLKLSKMRMEMMRGINGSTIINDAYNASPTSMKAAIDTIGKLSGFKKKIVLLGDMFELGEREREFHRSVGESIDQNRIHFVFTYGKLAKYIAEGARKNFSAQHVSFFKDQKELLQRLKSMLDEGTLLFLKASRGMRLEKIMEELLEKNA
ncbi:UDP-N-acetylmuramoyl-tripeptide--D-alanyl-D-alanine ligase [Fervidibacillus halotolerans]|uniref:UDP-N-acetylmuramoyl-tripeptide--D-alanyl-D-alanine ligase n=1 Tax=Fervidibacillus halotolerans TaxID=2980027 RepID=A0A9E8RYV2_9BACI|nr:UDP-N-acetylmuramoyl-tripeptide--D-alanyl-D-alanine ligase [Fervidibacillus halotolerans]WAA12554.1 UDP-N-acetylmuramoyl-tripeptide--D-alanyl-D-alanine ligase [Fervidibacillus halotolerans]